MYNACNTLTNTVITHARSVYLPCTHWFCVVCTAHLLKEAKKKVQSTSFLCPICRTDTDYKDVLTHSGKSPIEEYKKYLGKKPKPNVPSQSADIGILARNPDAIFLTYTIGHVSSAVNCDFFTSYVVIIYSCNQETFTLYNKQVSRLEGEYMWDDTLLDFGIRSFDQQRTTYIA